MSAHAPFLMPHASGYDPPVLATLKRAVRRILPRKIHPLLDRDLELTLHDITFEHAYHRIERDDSDFVRGRYREGVRWRQVIEALQPMDNRLMLDAGAGNGAIEKAFSASGANTVISTDASWNETARRLGTKRIIADVLRLPFRNRVFNTVLCLETIEHIEDARALADELTRVTRPGGIILLTTPVRWRHLFADPHFGIRGLMFLPPSWQRRVAAKRGFDQPHHYVSRIYSSVAQIEKLFPAFRVTVLSRSRAPQRWFWDALVLQKVRL